MRRFLTTLMILLIVLVAGLSALVLLVDPDDFRDYMVRQVAARSGYQLRLEGPLRWHVWPQLSILSGQVSLTAPGAAVPQVSAENMRLDVALLPLLSHRLKVNQVMLRRAVIQITPRTESVRAKDAPIAPREDVSVDRGWSFDIARLKITDSVLVWQHQGGEQVTVRDINLGMEQNQKHRGVIAFSGRVNRNQRDLTLSFQGEVNGSDYPRVLSADIQQLSWRLQGADLPAQGIAGQGQLQASWQGEQNKLTLNGLNLTANDSSLTGQASVVTAAEPQWSLDLHFGTLNLENLLVLRQSSRAIAAERPQQAGGQVTQPLPVIASDVDQPDYQDLKGFSADITLQADRVRWRGMAFTDVSGQFSNRAGLFIISTLRGKMGAGDISLPGMLDARHGALRAVFSPRLHSVDAGTILKAFNYPGPLNATLSLTGDFSGDKFDAEAFRRSWQGQARVEMRDARIEGLNFQQLVRQAVERISGDEGQEIYENATRLNELSASVTLNSGQLTLNDIQGQSSSLALTGNGMLDLTRQLCDIRFNIHASAGWTGDSKIVALLKATPVPLRVYGQWQSLNYRLQVDQLLRNQLRDEAKRWLDSQAPRNKNTHPAQDVRQQPDQQ